uniref:Reverse transcriptase domain-containing protein n=1 Tax=Tanacetum cinerariifolium TaxID=118510 RepID=A0A6L2L4T4_TANCI|nr:reverse transcriptase domain-containing protein [Tanacetum cinerariifolium]
MADQRTMAQLLQAPTEVYDDAIVVPAITAKKFELKHGLLTLVQNKRFFGHDKENPHAHVRYFNKINSTLKFPNVLNTSIKLILFYFPLKVQPGFGWRKNHLDRFLLGMILFQNSSTNQDTLNSAASGNFLEKMPRECLAIIESKSKVRHSRNKPVVAKVGTNTSTSGISPNVAELKDTVKALLPDKKSQNQSPAPVKAVEESCVTCGGAHSYRNTSYRPLMMSNQIRPPGFPPVPNNQNVQRNNQKYFIPNQTQGNNFNQGPVYQPPVFQPPAYQAPAYQAPTPQTQGVSKEDFSAYVKANDAMMINMQNQGQNMQNQLTNLTDLIIEFVKSNSASTSSSGTLPSNIIANQRIDLKAITTRSGVSYDGPQIPPSTSFLPKVVENEPEATKDTVNPTNNGSTEDPAIASVSASKPNQKTSIPYPSRRNDEINREKANNQIEKFYQIFKDMSMAECLALADLGASINLMPFSVWKRHSLPDLTPMYFDAAPRVPLILERSFLKTERAIIDVFEGELTLRVGKEAITFNLDQTLRYSTNYSDMTAKRIDVIDMACEDDFLLEEVDAFLAIEDEPTSYEFYQPHLDPEGDILLLEAFINDDPSLPPLNQRNYLPEVRKELKICETKSDKSSFDEPPMVELKDLPPHLEYAFVEGDDKLPVIIAKDLSVEEKTTLNCFKSSEGVYLARKPLRSSRLAIIDPHKSVYEKAFHLLVELEHKAYWAIKYENFDLKAAGDHRKVQINELNELRDQAYENSLIYKEKTKRLHESKIKNCVFNIGDRVLLFNSLLKIFFDKLKSRWSGPFTISQVYPYGTVELS